MRPLLLAGLLIACKGEDPASSNPTDDGGPTPSDQPTPTPQPCGALIVGSNPVDGAEDVDVAAEIRIQYNAEVTDADTWTLGLQPSVAGTATLNDDGLGATFIPDEPLDYETTYAIAAEACEDGALFTFTTGPEPLTDDDVEGKTYAVASPNIAFTSPPPAVIALVGGFADYILVQIDDIDDVSREFTANAGAANVVNGVTTLDCQFAFDAGVGDFTNAPLIDVGPTEFILPLGGNNITVEDFELSGEIGPSGDSIRDLSITGAIDTRTINIGLDVCLLALGAGLNCVPCNDGAPRCLNLAATATQGDWDPALDISGTCAL